MDWVTLHKTYNNVHSDYLRWLFLRAALFPALYFRCEIDKVKAIAVRFNFRECLVMCY